MLDNDTPFALAVVGAAGSGKSTIALQIAERSGAMYLDKDALAGPLVNALLTSPGGYQPRSVKATLSIETK